MFRRVLQSQAVADVFCSLIVFTLKMEAVPPKRRFLHEPHGDIPEDIRIVSIIRVRRIGELGTTQRASVASY
jgi:hypothetical protein